MRRVLCMLAVAFGIGAIAAPASATIMILTFTGLTTGSDVSDNIDNLALFGGNLYEAPYVATIKYDTSKGDISVFGSGYELNYTATSNPFISESISIGGRSVTLSGAGSIVLTPSAAGDASGKINASIGYDGLGVIELLSLSGNLLPGLSSFTAPYDYTHTFTQSYAGEFDVYGSGGYPTLDHISFQQETVSLTSAVPEPTTWVMLILGMGTIGFAARRRNQSVTVTA